jgi:hypothetical protein
MPKRKRELMEPKAGDKRFVRRDSKDSSPTSLTSGGRWHEMSNNLPRRLSRRAKAIAGIRRSPSQFVATARLAIASSRS